MQKITAGSLTALLASLKGSTPITFDYTSKPKRPGKGMRKGAPWESLTHRIRVNGLVGVDYENSVNRQREREEKDADFEAQERPYGERVQTLLTHNNAVMVPVKVQRYLEDEWLDQDGNAVDPDEVKQYLYKKSSRQGVDKQVDWKNFLVSSMGPYVALESETYEVGAA